MNDKNVPAIIQQKRDIKALINSDNFKLEIAKVLPKHLTPERMTRVALTAFMKTPALLDCTQESLLNSLLICSQAGLEPDGRLAHLIPYGKVCTVIFDFKGLVTLALRNGVELIYADKVCEADEFDARVSDGEKKLSHIVCYKKSRGEPYCYYAVARSRGVTDWEVMTKEEVDSIRARSKAGRSGPWVTDYDEMAKKTVLRRMSKRWDLIPEIRDIINADDDVPQEVKAPLMKPVFDAPPAPLPATDPAASLEQPAPRADAPQADATVNYVKAVRSLCKIAKITEGAVLDFLASTGTTDGSVGTLEELAVHGDGNILKTVHDQWTDIVTRIRAVKETNE